MISHLVRKQKKGASSTSSPLPYYFQVDKEDFWCLLESAARLSTLFKLLLINYSRKKMKMEEARRAGETAAQFF